MATKAPQDRKPEDELHLFKVVVTPVFARRNAKGEIVEEIPTTKPVSIYKPEFDQFSKLMQEALETVKRNLAAQQNGSG